MHQTKTTKLRKFSASKHCSNAFRYLTFCITEFFRGHRKSAYSEEHLPFLSPTLDHGTLQLGWITYIAIRKKTYTVRYYTNFTKIKIRVLLEATNSRDFQIYNKNNTENTSSHTHWSFIMKMRWSTNNIYY